MRRFIKWEMLDLEAMIETIESKNEIMRRRDKLKTSKIKDTQEIKKLQNGSRFFMSHSYKVNRITVLNDRIELTEREIDCAEVLMKIIYLYQQDVAIPFFRMDKLGVYNGAINLYGLKQINNCEIISDFYRTVIGQNQIEMTHEQQQLGNTTLFEQPVLKVRLKGAENPANVTTVKPVLNQLLAPIKENDMEEF